jgi:hypothetical protein
MIITKSLWSMVMLIIIHTRNGNGEEEIIVIHIKIDISLFKVIDCWHLNSQSITNKEVRAIRET